MANGGISPGTSYQNLIFKRKEILPRITSYNTEWEINKFKKYLSFILQLSFIRHEVQHAHTLPFIDICLLILNSNRVTIHQTITKTMDYFTS